MGGVIDLICEGYKTIFIVDEEKLMGCITEGDIKRMFREFVEEEIDFSEIGLNTELSPNYSVNEYKNLLEDYTKKMNKEFLEGDGKEINFLLGNLINVNCKKIVYVNEEQAEIEAKEIFEKYKRIQSVPVVDMKGKLCFQYVIGNEKQKEKILKELEWLESVHAAIRYFFQWFGDRKYIITGADQESMQMAADYLQKSMQHIGVYINISVCSLRDINYKKESFIICLCDSAKFYLLFRDKAFQTGIISLNEFRRYCSVKGRGLESLLKIEKRDIEIWKDLFGYQIIIFNTSNLYVRYLEPILISCGIKVYINVKKESIKAISITEKKKFMIDTINIGSLALSLEIIRAYLYIIGKEISRKEYIESFFRLLKEKMKNQKLVYLYKNSGIIDYEIYRKLVEDNIIKVCMIENKNENKNQCFICEEGLRTSIFILLIEEKIIQKFNSTFEKVYVHKQQDSSCKLEIYRDRTIINAKKHQEDCFGDKFFEEIYGNEYKEKDNIINDILGRNGVQCLHTCYSKLQSNYYTKYYSTDTYGNIIVNDVPEKYYGTIYLIGNCIYFGYAVSDKHTVASFLQKKLNQMGILYRVVVLTGYTGLWTKYMKIQERKIQSQDIIILQPENYLFQYNEKNIIYTNWDELDKKISNKNWYWDFPWHCNYQGYEIIANQIYEKIEKDLITKYLPTFVLEDKLEKEIQLYLEELQAYINSNLKYKTIMQEHEKKELICGAVVMNCNPFTNGHLYLIETVARLVDLLYVFVVEEDKSDIPFSNRFQMVEKGTCHISNIIVLPSGKFMISSLTFSGYFCKDNPEKASYDSFLDLKIFAHYISPTLNIKMRFVGEEPFDSVTAQYNKDMKIILGAEKIIVIEIPRKSIGKQIITATGVRRLLKEKDWEKIKKFVPNTTLDILQKINFA